MVFPFGCLAQPNIDPVRYLKNLLLKLVVAHKLLDRGQVPPLEESLLKFLNVGPTQRLDESEIIAIDSVLDPGHRDDNLEVAIVWKEDACFQFVQAVHELAFLVSSHQRRRAALLVFCARVFGEQARHRVPVLLHGGAHDLLSLGCICLLR